jgi:hypothetical protein
MSAPVHILKSSRFPTVPGVDTTKWQTESVHDERPYWLKWLEGEVTGRDSAPEADPEQDQHGQQDVEAHEQQ